MRIRQFFHTVRATILGWPDALRRLTYPQYYMIGAILILTLSTIYWAFLSAQINLHNADQLVSPFLFEHRAVFHDAIFPSAHTFILKWPLFALLGLIGATPALFVVTTILLTLLTVGLFVFILYRIERRPLVFGTLILALASALLLIPTEPYPGALLPVNMGMISTRNIEYVLYILAIILLIRTRRIFNWRPLVATLILAALIASDKLFLAFTVGGAGLSLIVALLRRRSTERNLALLWLTSGIIAALLSMAGLWLLTKLGITSLQETSQTGPYPFVHSFKDAMIGIIYAVLGIFTNMGANPVFDVTIIKSIPAAIFHRLFSLAGPAFLVNVMLVGLASFASFTLLRGNKEEQGNSQSTARLLAISLLWTTVAALIVFAASDHYYPVDARYLSIATFAAFLLIATYLRSRHFTPRHIAITGAVILVFGIGLGIVGAWQQAAASEAVYSQTARQDQAIASALQQRPVTTLIGDYWRVMPVKSHEPDQAILPLADCFTPRDVLLSKAWQPNITSSSFAYILSLKPSITGFPACTIDQVVARYGRPNSSQLIAGTVSHPDEMLLFYDYGTTNSVQWANREVSAAILPKPLAKNTYTTCTTGSTVMNIVAHQDDDILFINPDTYHNIKAGKCVRSIYITAGDAGSAQFYWLSREEGSKAAYATMLGITNPQWVTRTLALSDTAYATLAYIKGSPQVSLLFLHLPDGNINGQGFPATHHESLAKLEHGSISTIHTIDGQSTYSPEELVNALTAIMNTYEPSEINTQALVNLSKKHPDHSDHLMAGWFTNQAYQHYHEQHPDTKIQFYIGYPERDRPANVTGNDLAVTEAAFFAYAQHDKGTCESVIACSKMSYGDYLSRQYRD